MALHRPEETSLGWILPEDNVELLSVCEDVLVVGLRGKGGIQEACANKHARVATLVRVDGGEDREAVETDLLEI